MSFAADHHERCSSTTACACFAVAAGVAAVTAIAAVAPSSAATPRAKAWVSERPHGPSPGLRAMLREIDPGRIRSDIHTLVGFGTRHTLSSQDDPQRGIGAAREWIYAQFQSSWSNAVTPRRAKRSPAASRHCGRASAKRASRLRLISLLAYAGPRPKSEALPLRWAAIRRRTILFQATKRGVPYEARSQPAEWRRNRVGASASPARPTRPEGGACFRGVSRRLDDAAAS